MDALQLQQRQILEEVISLPTAPLHEDQVIQYIKKFVTLLNLPLQEDNAGNLIVRYSGDSSVPAIGFVAHMDHPGFEVEAVENGRIKLGFRGGAACPRKNDSLLLCYHGQTTTVVVDEIGYDAEKPAYIMGCGKNLNLTSGFAFHNLVPFRQEGDKILSRAIDDLAGCAALLALLTLWVREKTKAHVYTIFTRAEEIGFIGAYALATGRLLPHDLPLISIEASKMLPGAEQGKGVVVRIGDRRAIFHPQITAYLSEVAQELSQKDQEFLFQKRLLDGGTCEAALFNTFGYPSSGLAVPLGCYHNQGDDGKVAAEHIHLHDWFNMIKLLHAASTHTERLVGWEAKQRAYFQERFDKYKVRIIKIEA